MRDILDEPDFEQKPLETASRMDRLVSTLIDVCLFFLVTFFLNDLFIEGLYTDFLLDNWFALAPLGLFYLLYFQASEAQATLGMQLMKIRILGEDKHDVGLTAVIKRTGINMLLFFNFLILSGPMRQSPADKFAKTIVIKK
jgi:uncharacterized RDD family membrane protein YckC